MATAVKMPKLSDTMEEGVVSAWLAEEGDEVSAGDVIAQVETDKATMDLEVFDDGVLLKRVAEEGQTVPMGELLAVLGEKGEDIHAILAGYGLTAAEFSSGSESEGQGKGGSAFLLDDDASAETPLAGHVYVLVNPVYGLDKVKIGVTTCDPVQRARELSQSAGVPEPFTLAYKAQVPEYRQIGREIHDVLKERANPSREFFEIDLHRAVSIVNRVVLRRMFGNQIA